ncbi:MAG: type II secretion system protein [Verrucomicrobiota bacterium]
MKPTRSLSRISGMSLVEMLVVIAVIGVISAIAVPNISSFRSITERSKDRRNAQQLCTMYAAGKATWIDFRFDDDVAKTGFSADAAVIVQRIVAGRTVSAGNFAGTFMGIPGMNSQQQTNALSYIEYSDGELKYVP